MSETSELKATIKPLDDFISTIQDRTDRVWVVVRTLKASASKLNGAEPENNTEEDKRDATSTLEQLSDGLTHLSDAVTALEHQANRLDEVI